MTDNLVKLEELLRDIEILRVKLHEIAEGKNFSDPEVVYASQMLDEILNIYQREFQRKSR